MIAGFFLLGGLLIGIALFWFRFSAKYDQQEKLSAFLKINIKSRLEKDMTIQVKRFSGKKDLSIVKWEICDLYLFPEGIILSGDINPEGFYDCIFLSLNNPELSRIKGCKIRGKYSVPAIYENALRYEIFLAEFGLTYFVGRTVQFDIFPGTRTIELLRQKGLL
jgi:hypothetical protein